MAGKISRRDALKTMMVGGTGLALGTSVFSCNSSAPSAPAAGVPQSSAEGISTKYWESTGDTVSLLGLGCMRFPFMEGSDTVLDQAAINEMFDYALAHGINYFDTAPFYQGGESEIALGIAAVRHPRESYMLATKMSSHHFLQDNPQISAEEIYEKSVALYNQSCERLRTDYFDYYLCHNIGGGSGGGIPSFELRFIRSGVLNWLMEKRQRGEIRHLGFSFHGDYRAFDHFIALHDQGQVHWDFVQIQMNYYDWTYVGNGTDNAKYLYDELVKRNIPVVVMEPIRGGALARVSDALRDRMAQVRPDMSPAGLALDYVASHPGVMTTLSGMSNMEQLIENINTFSPLQTLSEDEQAVMETDIARLFGENRPIGCTACDYCMPCPYGVNIPANLRVADACTSQLNMPNPDGEHDKEYMRKRRLFLNRYKNAMEPEQRAEFCINCGQCQPKCPQGIRIPRELEKIQTLVEKLKRI